jgi:hypothetical protein
MDIKENLYYAHMFFFFFLVYYYMEIRTQNKSLGIPTETLFLNKNVEKKKVFFFPIIFRFYGELVFHNISFDVLRRSREKKI